MRNSAPLIFRVAEGQRTNGDVYSSILVETKKRPVFAGRASASNADVDLVDNDLYSS